ncbi:ABC transporter substrate-binding protein [Paenibacillus lactis]|uniref:Extracellular solute-binding protein family 1 n=2 Tax=Paenibacillus lactis TaxID=228574 RepID=G4HMU5_9BACL|nr:extracellular solute-binding protein [Paenibacillus lactis]EHB54310.1 extracellular solute-binding protein family 1 [Paenibacillus lactis 154]MBP1891569.1 raffinose/stachyose/melibiose transport system substrate-binding protein [Paenibacillus lactis]MCM3494033.1 extracellular solute-binding protein [Paenibacillus lactis]HAG00426.1 ABC transporter substrate-binding protein [Paenibacillus lactis]
MKFGKGLAASVSILLICMLTACGGSDTSGRVQIEFFQNKPEAKGSFDALIQKFNESQSDITVVQVNPPDAETVLKTRVVKDDIPDIVGMGATDTYSLLAQSGIFMDMTGSPLLSRIDETYVQMLKDVSGMEEVIGIPYSTNANGVMYNKDIFSKLGLSVPRTWDELLATAKKAKDGGTIPFYFTYKDDWQTVLPFNALASNLEGIEFYLDRREGKVTFADRYREIAEKQLELMEYGHGDNFGKNYADGNRAFARGESAMYIQGTWAISEIRKANPEAPIGFFPLPTGDDPESNKLISGVDTLLAVAEESKHKEEAMRFIEFLLEPENSKQYISEQTLFSTVQGVTQDDPAVAELLPYLERGQVVDFADHYIPAAVQLNSIIQSFLQNRDIDAYLKKLDTEWDKVADRR